METHRIWRHTGFCQVRQSCSDRPIFDLIIGVGEKSMGPRRSSSGTSPRPWTPGGMSPQCASSFHYLSLASALGGDTFPHRPPSNFTGAPAGRMAASFASRPNVCQPPRVIIVRSTRLYCGLMYASTVEDICARGCCSISHAGIGYTSSRFMPSCRSARSSPRHHFRWKNVAPGRYASLERAWFSRRSGRPRWRVQKAAACTEPASRVTAGE